MFSLALSSFFYLILIDSVSLGLLENIICFPEIGVEGKTQVHQRLKRLV